MADSLGSWLVELIVAHDRKHGANLAITWSGKRYCQLTQVTSPATGVISDRTHHCRALFLPEQQDRDELSSPPNVGLQLRAVLEITSARIRLAQAVDTESNAPLASVYLEVLEWGTKAGDRNDPTFFPDTEDINGAIRVAKILHKWWSGQSSSGTVQPTPQSSVAASVMETQIMPEAGPSKPRQSATTAPYVSGDSTSLKEFLDLPIGEKGEKGEKGNIRGKHIPDWIFDLPAETQRELDNIHIFGLDISTNASQIESLSQELASSASASHKPSQPETPMTDRKCKGKASPAATPSFPEPGQRVPTGTTVVDSSNSDPGPRLSGSSGSGHPNGRSPGASRPFNPLAFGASPADLFAPVPVQAVPHERTQPFAQERSDEEEENDEGEEGEDEEDVPDDQLSDYSRQKRKERRASHSSPNTHSYDTGHANHVTIDIDTSEESKNSGGKEESQSLAASHNSREEDYSLGKKYGSSSPRKETPPDAHHHVEDCSGSTSGGPDAADVTVRESLDVVDEQPRGTGEQGDSNRVTSQSLFSPPHLVRAIPKPLKRRYSSLQVDDHQLQASKRPCFADQRPKNRADVAPSSPNDAAPMTEEPQADDLPDIPLPPPSPERAPHRHLADRKFSLATPTAHKRPRGRASFTPTIIKKEQQTPVSEHKAPVTPATPVRSSAEPIKSALTHSGPRHSGREAIGRALSEAIEREGVVDGVNAVDLERLTDVVGVAWKSIREQSRGATAEPAMVPPDALSDRLEVGAEIEPAAVAGRDEAQDRADPDQTATSDAQRQEVLNEESMVMQLDSHESWDEFPSIINVQPRDTTDDIAIPPDMIGADDLPSPIANQAEEPLREPGVSTDVPLEITDPVYATAQHTANQSPVNAVRHSPPVGPDRRSAARKVTSGRAPLLGGYQPDLSPPAGLGLTQAWVQRQLESIRNKRAKGQK